MVSPRILATKSALKNRDWNIIIFIVFENELNKLLLATNENTSLSITAIVSKMISECKSQFLIKEISVFLLGSETKDPEIKGEKERFSRND